jgi:hypothetical protein
MQTSKEKGAKAPQSAAQRKAAQRARLKAQGLVSVKFPELWVTPEQAREIEFRTADFIEDFLERFHANNDNPKPDNC